ncbi:MAG: Stf0 family sulfotransferase [Saprospiraceae bacterium]
MKYHKPTRSYRIWFSQRNGSTVLAKMLEQTGIAGKPQELFNIYDTTLCEHYGVKGYDALLEKLWQIGATKNGIMSVKHCLFRHRLDPILMELADLQGISTKEEINAETVFADLFPDCKHIFLTRRNKVRQAVSWWKAIKDQQWHLTSDQSHRNDEAFYEEHYNFDALSHLLKETVLRECQIQAYFAKYDIVPLTLVYEDFVQDFPATIRQILDYIEVDHSNLPLGEPPLKRTATDLSEIWVQRFRKDLQADWKQQIW